MRKMVKHLLKKFKYPPVAYDTAISTVISQCEMWTDNMVVWIVWNVVDLCLTIGFLFYKIILENTIIENTKDCFMEKMILDDLRKRLERLDDRQ